MQNKKNLPKSQYELSTGDEDKRFTRANEVRRDDDKLKELTIGLFEIDYCLKWYFDNVIKPEALFDELDQWDTPAIATPPVYGTTTINGLLINYTPASGWVGTEEFTYTIRDLAGNVSPPATVTVTVV